MAKEPSSTAQEVEPAEEAADLPIELGLAAAVPLAAAEEAAAGPAAAKEVYLFTIGDRVQLVGLLMPKAIQLNGQSGTITRSEPDKGRSGVWLQSGT